MLYGLEWKNIDDLKKYKIWTGAIHTGLEWKKMDYKWPLLLEEVV